MNIDDQIRAMADAGDAVYSAPMASATQAGGGWAEQLGALASGYLSRRIDIDLSNRVQQPGTAQQRTKQTPIAQDVRASEAFGMSGQTLMLVGLAIVIGAAVIAAAKA